MFLKKLILLILLITSVLLDQAVFGKPKEEYYEIKIYHLATQEQEQMVDSYLQHAFIPALHRKGIDKIGVFKPIGNDTAKVRLIYVLVPYKTEKQFFGMADQLEKDQQYNTDGQAYINSAFNKPPYQRVESILLKAFSHMPVMQLPEFKNGPEEKEKRIYELRSYESATEKIFQNKVHMFNEGGEVGIFTRLGFNPVFFWRGVIRQPYAQPDVYDLI